MNFCSSSISKDAPNNEIILFVIPIAFLRYKSYKLLHVLFFCMKSKLIRLILFHNNIHTECTYSCTIHPNHLLNIEKKEKSFLEIGSSI